ncbi:MAG: hypothetical protein ACLFVD_02960 [Dehalococcoidia bacterium]
MTGQVKSTTAQASLFQGIRDVETRVISRRLDFESLFDGFTRMRAIAYVVSSDLLREFFEKRGYSDVEMVVGEDMTEPALRQELQDKPLEILESLAARVESGALRILIPRRSIHTKLYILDNGETARVIQTSANLTETARKATQVNYAWYADLPARHEFVRRVLQDYSSHTKHCTLFMEDLSRLLADHDSDSKRELIEVWLKGEALPASELETAKVFREMSIQSLLAADTAEGSVVTVKLPEAPAARKEIERFLKPLSPSMTGNQTTLRASAFINHVHVTYGIPLMRLDPERCGLRLGLKGAIVHLSHPPADRPAVNEALQHLEDYIQTVDLAKSPDPSFAKASMFEALLYVFFSPFASEYMRRRRLAYGQADPKGPRFLYVYGPSQNGKTTFFRFALKLLTGQDMEALRREEFTRRKIRGAAAIGTVFPLVFDDVELSGKPWAADLIKSYWETWWTSPSDVPQILMSSNEPRLRDWARSRVKRVDFDVHFASTGQEKRRLKALLEYHNQIFRWFSNLYLRQLAADDEFSDDELFIARTVMRRLYEYAGRRQPDFFLSQPVENQYDLGRKRWIDLVYGRREAKVVREKERTLVRFPDQMQFWEIRRFEGYLPPEVKARQEGHTIIIETPDDFDAWCPAPDRRLWPRLWKRS